jgi:hypothetical protein
VADSFREYKFRRLIPITADEYEQEPAHNTEWFPKFAQIEDEIQAETMKAKP